MKQTTEHLPELKRDELKRILSIIRDKCHDLEMIILFGSYARGDYKVEADLKPDRRSGHASDYDILVVTRCRETADSSLFWHGITEACNALKLSAHPRIIVHDIHFLNRQIAEGHYFYSDIKKDGCMLFDSHEFKLEHKHHLTSEEKQEIARENFKEWFESAEQFYGNFEFNMGKKWYKKAAFMLHQSAEHSYKLTN